jgi:hypothetical protein
MFPENAADPQFFRAALKFKAPDVRNQQLEYVNPFVFKSCKNRQPRFYNASAGGRWRMRTVSAIRKA